MKTSAIKTKVGRKKSRRETRGSKVAASLVVYGAPRFSESGRRDIADWLLKLSRCVRGKRTAESLAEVFRARYYYPSRPVRSRKAK